MMWYYIFLKYFLGRKDPTAQIDNMTLQRIAGLSACREQTTIQLIYVK